MWNAYWLSFDPPQVPLGDYLNLLKTNGNFVQLGAPALPEIQVAILIFRGLSLSGSLIGSPTEIREMLDFAVKKNVHPLIEEKPMHDANNVITDMDKGLARYRYVLVNWGTPESANSQNGMLVQ